MLIHRIQSLQPLLLLLCLSIWPAQSLLAQQSQVLNGKNYIYTVADLERSVAFYEEAFGLSTEVSRADPTAIEPVQRLVNSAQSRIRVAYVDIPQAPFLLEFTEFTNVERKPVRFNMHDPGNARLALYVSDIDAVLANALAAGATIETIGGEILRRDYPGGRYNRAIFLRDPDGFLLELIETFPKQETIAGPAILRGNFSITVSDIQKSREFWSHFGLPLEPIAGFENGRNDPTSNLLGATEGATMFGAYAVVQGAEFDWSVYEFRNIGRQSVVADLVDPGAPALSMFVNDMDATLQAIAETGAEIVSANNEAVDFGDTRNIFVRGPDGFLYEFIGP